MSEEKTKTLEERVEALEAKVKELEKQLKQKADAAYVNQVTHRPKAVGGPRR